MAAVPRVGLIAVMEEEPETGGLSGTAGKKVTLSKETVPPSYVCLQGIIGIRVFVIDTFED